MSNYDQEELDRASQEDLDLALAISLSEISHSDQRDVNCGQSAAFLTNEEMKKNERNESNGRNEKSIEKSDSSILSRLLRPSDGNTIARPSEKPNKNWPPTSSTRPKPNPIPDPIANPNHVSSKSPMTSFTDQAKQLFSQG
jgi:hypothetical protein